MPKLSLDINGSKEQNAGPWCFNYSLFRGYASNKLQKHNFPVRIIFCRLLQCFCLKLFDLYLQESSVHDYVFIYSPVKCFTGSMQCRLEGISAEHHIQTPSQHRVN